MSWELSRKYISIAILISFVTSLFVVVNISSTGILRITGIPLSMFSGSQANVSVTNRSK